MQPQLTHSNRARFTHSAVPFDRYQVACEHFREVGNVARHNVKNNLQRGIESSTATCTSSFEMLVSPEGPAPEPLRRPLRTSTSISGVICTGVVSETSASGVSAWGVQFCKFFLHSLCIGLSKLRPLKNLHTSLDAPLL